MAVDELPLVPLAETSFPMRDAMSMPREYSREWTRMQAGEY